MPRPIWTGAISFGLVNVPVRLFSAVSQKEVRFHQLHAKDGGRIRMKRVCSVDGKEVPYEDIVKGYEVGPDQYVEITPEELEKFDPKASKAIDIEDFVKEDQIDPIFFDHPYFVAPDKGADKAFALLVEAMRVQKKVGIARMVMRTKQYLCLLRPFENGLNLTTLNYADEVNDIGDLELPSEHDKPKERELKMAEQLIDTLTAKKWEPEKYRDDFRDKVLAYIESKAHGEKVVSISEEPKATKTVDLMEALRASLSMGRAKPAEGTPANEDAESSEAEGEIRHRAAAAREARPAHHSTRKKSSKKSASHKHHKK